MREGGKGLISDGKKWDLRGEEMGWPDGGDLFGRCCLFLDLLMSDDNPAGLQPFMQKPQRVKGCDPQNHRQLQEVHGVVKQLKI